MQMEWILFTEQTLLKKKVTTCDQKQIVSSIIRTLKIPDTGMFSVSRLDISAAAEYVTEHIHFCLEESVPIWTVRCCAKNKLRITRDPKELPNKRKEPSGNKMRIQEGVVQQQLNTVLQKEKAED